MRGRMDEECLGEMGGRWEEVKMMMSRIIGRRRRRTDEVEVIVEMSLILGRRRRWSGCSGS